MSTKRYRYILRSKALIALVVGALCAGAAATLVRLTDTSPAATAFWRGCLAFPLLAVWAVFEPKKPRRPGATTSVTFLPLLRDRRFWWAGAFFAGDLYCWNWSLQLTSVAVATLEVSLAPLLIAFIAWVLWRERPTLRFAAALLLSIAGMLLMLSPKLGQGRSAFAGDALGLATAGFFSGYILVIQQVRAQHGTGVVMLNTTLVTSLIVLPIALLHDFLPGTPSGWLALAGCALLAQVLGQGLIAYALAHLHPTFGSLGLFLQTLGAAASSWLLLGERLAAPQMLGALVIVGAIALARGAYRSGVRPAVATSLGMVGD